MQKTPQVTEKKDRVDPGVARETTDAPYRQWNESDSDSVSVPTDNTFCSMSFRSLK